MLYVLWLSEKNSKKSQKIYTNVEMIIRGLRRCVDAMICDIPAPVSYNKKYLLFFAD